ncbi:hypothetical protein F5Y01DRAFT_270024 [Xylaria sp. FL0043]|nr:hypothetical protein F5Y01DRAFT_270024 [Xylaria sp. FL0043]
MSYLSLSSSLFFPFVCLVVIVVAPVLPQTQRVDFYVQEDRQTSAVQLYVAVVKDQRAEPLTCPSNSAEGDSLHIRLCHIFYPISVRVMCNTHCTHSSILNGSNYL